MKIFFAKSIFAYSASSDPSSTASHRKIVCTPPSWGTWLRAHCLGIEREEKSPEPGRNQTHGFNIFAQQACALPLCPSNETIFNFWRRRSIERFTKVSKHLSGFSKRLSPISDFLFQAQASKLKSNFEMFDKILNNFQASEFFSYRTCYFTEKGSATSSACR